MQNLETTLLALRGWTGYLFLFLSSLLENLIPPMPGDTFVVLGAFLVGRGQLDFVPAYLATTAGSILGFSILFLAGRKWGRSFFTGKRRAIFSEKDLDRIEKWFAKYGLWVILCNRFLSGFRAVVSLAAGIGGMKPGTVLGLGLLSCMVWNAILMALGIWVGENWRLLLENYQRTVVILIMVLLALWLAREQWKKRKRHAAGRDAS